MGRAIGNRIRLALVASAVVTALSATAATAATWYVSQAALKKGAVRNGQSWATADNVIQDAVNRAASGDQIWVAKGTYKETVRIFGKSLSLYGGFAGTESSPASRTNIAGNASVVDAGKAGSVFYFSNCTFGANRLDGFTVRNGYGEVLPGWTAKVGGGVFAYQSDNLAIENSLIEGNGGDNTLIGAPNPLPPEKTAALDNLVFYGGGVYVQSTPVSIRNNVIRYNVFYPGGAGGGIAVSNGWYPGQYSAVIDNNTIEANGCPLEMGGGGGGIYYGGSVAIVRNRILRNLAGSGGGIAAGYSGGVQSVGLVQGNLFEGNRAVYSHGNGGAMVTGSASHVDEVVNNTFVANQAACASALMVAGGTVANNIIAESSGDLAIRLASTTDVRTFDRNLVSDNTTDSCPLAVSYNWQPAPPPFSTATPGFVDRAQKNYRLRYDSPAVGTGNPSLVDPAWTDLDFNPFLRGSVSDLGAYAFKPESPAVPPAVVSTSPAAGATGVSLTPTITVTFGENVIDGPNYGLVSMTGPLAVSINKSIVGKVLTITPLGRLSASTVYTVRVPAGSVADPSGNPLAGDKVFSFTTGRR